MSLATGSDPSYMKRKALGGRRRRKGQGEKDAEDVKLCLAWREIGDFGGDV